MFFFHKRQFHNSQFAIVAPTTMESACDNQIIATIDNESGEDANISSDLLSILESLQFVFSCCHKKTQTV